jgi:cellulose biosynthesis protein BcsQ
VIDHRILAFVSGKGGVGKTMLSVAFATELSKRKKTLLFDVDFFNRGLSGLFASLDYDSAGKVISPPDFLFGTGNDSGIGQTLDKNWKISEVKENLHTITYGDLDQAIFEKLEAIQLSLLVDKLRRYTCASI